MSPLWKLFHYPFFLINFVYLCLTIIIFHLFIIYLHYHFIFSFFSSAGPKFSPWGMQHILKFLLSPTHRMSWDVPCSHAMRSATRRWPSTPKDTAPWVYSGRIRIILFTTRHIITSPSTTSTWKLWTQWCMTGMPSAVSCTFPLTSCPCCPALLVSAVCCVCVTVCVPVCVYCKTDLCYDLNLT